MFAHSEAIRLRVPSAIAGTGIRIAASIFLILILVFGGGAAQGFWSDAFLEVVSLPLFIVMGSQFVLSPPTSAQRWPMLLLLGFLALPLLQLIPIPPAIWSILPDRANIASAYRDAGMTLPWLAISLDPLATWRSVFSMLPAAAFFMIVLSLDVQSRRFMILLLMMIAVVSVLLDVLQTMGGEGSPFRFYAITNVDRAVGFFANSNHNAAFLYSVVPFIGAWSFDIMCGRRRGRRYIAIMAALALLLAAIMVGLGLTKSRAGLVLGLVAVLSFNALAWCQRRSVSRRTLLLAAGGASLIAVLTAFQVGFVPFLQRAEAQDVMQDLRWPVAAITVRAAAANMPFGTGFGTFVPVYEAFAPRELLRETYVNHAHNDWLELWLDGGLPALALACGFIGWWVVASFQAWGNSKTVSDRSMAQAGSIVIFLILLHSAVDYPLRTAGMMTIFAFACALLVPFRGEQKLRNLPSAGLKTVRSNHVAPERLS